MVTAHKLITLVLFGLGATGAYAAEYSVFSTIQGYSGGAFGAHITESTSVGKSDIPTFDTTLGVLQAIKLDFSLTGTADCGMTHTDDNGDPVSGLSGSYKYSSSIGAVIYTGTTAPSVNFSAGADFHGSTPGSYLSFHDGYSGDQQLTLTDPDDLAGFSDGTMSPLYWEVDTNSFFTANLDGYSQNYFYDLYTVSSIPTVVAKVTYVYAVPEPSSLAVLGLAGGVLLRRRKRTSG